MAFIITLTGASQCGKSVVHNLLLKHADDIFHPVVFKKYTTRPARGYEDDITPVNKIPADCDLVYEQYGVRYGFHFDDLYDLLEQGKSPIIVLNDVRAVEDVRTALAPQVISIFMYRKPPIFESFLKEEKTRAADGSSEQLIYDTARSRFDKAKAIYRIYTENIYLFDHVILNIDDLKYTEQQVGHIVAVLKATIKQLED